MKTKNDVGNHNNEDNDSNVDEYGDVDSDILGDYVDSDLNWNSGNINGDDNNEDNENDVNINDINVDIKKWVVHEFLVMKI